MYEICFYSCLLGFYMLINVDYTVTYFLPVNSPKDCCFFSFFSIAPRFISIDGKNTTEN